MIRISVGFALLSAGVLLEPCASVRADETIAIPTNEKIAGQLRDDNGLRMQFVWCPKGFISFEGEADNRVSLRLSRGFWLGKHEVTQAQWHHVIGTKPWVGNGRVVIGDDIAATYVSWQAAEEFCGRLTEAERAAERLPAGWRYDLPTEAQWEYACRARTNTIFSFGDDEGQLSDYAWYSRMVRGTTLPGAARLAEGQPLQVGQKKPNPWGLCDMHGNVWEWCRDTYAELQPRGQDPKAEGDESYRVIRGGSWWNKALDCRSSRRDKHPPDHADYSLGFRVALVPAE